MGVISFDNVNRVLLIVVITQNRDLLIVLEPRGSNSQE
jgi:hypothetical protein